MVKSNYTFSSDKGKYPFQDMMKADELAEKFFHTKNDPDQLKINVRNDKRIYAKFPGCENIIKYEGKVIGETFILPCQKVIMNDFLKDKITEAEMFEKIMKEVNYENFDCVYLCLADIDIKHRGKGLASNGRLKTLIPLIKKNPHIILFGRAFSKEGNELLKNTAKMFKLSLLLKKH